MTSLTATEARKRLYTLLDDVAESHKAVTIAGKRNSAVLVSEEDWRAIQETLNLTSMPGMNKSIIEGLKTPVKKCSKEFVSLAHSARIKESKRIMKKTVKLTKSRKTDSDQLRHEYQFDYRKARPKRFARRGSKAPLIVALDPDVAKVFATSKSVNHALRALMTALPKK
jgi:antitoxin YefM